MTTYRFPGTVIDQTTRLGLQNMRVEAWDAEAKSADLIAFAVTGRGGAFTITLDDDYLAEHFHGRSPVIVFRVFEIQEATRLLVYHPSRYLVWKLASAASTTGRIEVNTTSSARSTAPSPGMLVVRGTVRTATGDVPAAGTTVQAFHKAVTGDITALNITPRDLDESGQYQISYGLAHDTPGYHAPTQLVFDLVVKVLDGSNTIIAESSPLYRAPAVATVDLTIGDAYRGQSELDGLHERLSTHLETFRIANATPDQCEHLAKSTDSDRAHVDALTAADTVYAETGGSSGGGLPVDVCYALVREGLPATTRELLFTPAAQLRAALQRAVAKNTVSASVGTDIDATLSTLRAKAVNAAFEVQTGGVGQLVVMAQSQDGTDMERTTAAEEFLDAYFANEDTPEAFWEAYSSSDKEDLRFAFQVEAVSLSHYPLIKELIVRKKATPGASLRDLAKYSEDEWVAILGTERDGQVIGYPSGTESAGDYAKLLRSTMEAAYPTAAIGGDLARLAPEDPIAAFLDAHTEFEFGKTRASRFLADHPSIVFDDDETTQLTRKRLKQIERLFRLTPRHAEMKPLLDDGLDSACKVVRKGRTEFLANYQTSLGAMAAAEMFANAQRTTSYAIAYQSSFGLTMNPPSPWTVPDLHTPSTDLQAASVAADWAGLFGSLDACDCGACTSVHGPAAYFVDLLEFLGRYTSDVEDDNHVKLTAQEVLRNRRPDLEHIELTCENTMKTLPYVDLVNEILERLVVAQAPPSAIATAGDPQDLRAMPGVAPLQQAYEVLKAAVHPFVLPFDLTCMEARTYLSHLGVPRADLMLTLRYTSGGHTVPGSLDLAAERLGLSQSELGVITGSYEGWAATPTPLERWGLSSGAITQLAYVPTLLQQSGLSYDELVDLLDTKFIQSFGTPQITPQDACTTSQMTISGATAETFEAIHRFIRLRNRLGYTFRELDQVITASGSGIDDGLLQRLAIIERLRTRFGLPVPLLASWFGPLDDHTRANERSCYDQIFRNQAVSNPAVPLTGTVGACADAIKSALRIGTGDFALLTDGNVAQAQTGATALLDGTTTISVEKLSELYRTVTFARALGLSSRDFLILVNLSGLDVNPCTIEAGDAPSSAEAFVEVVDGVRRTGFQAAELLYLFANVEPPGTALAPAPTAVNSVLDALYAGLVKLWEKLAARRDGEELQRILAEALRGRNLSPAAYDQLLSTSMGLISGELLSSTPPAMTLGEATQYFMNIAEFFWSPTDVTIGLFGGNPLTSPADRFNLAFMHLRSIKHECDRLIQQTLGAAVGLEAASAQMLLQSILTADNRPLIEVFALPTVGAEETLPATRAATSPDPQFDAYCRMDKAATLVRRMRMTAAELARLARPGTATAPIFPFDKLAAPGAAVVPADSRALFAAYQTLAGVLAMRSSLPGGSTALLGVFEALLAIPAAVSSSSFSAANLAHAISPLTGWSEPDVARLLSTVPGETPSCYEKRVTGLAKDAQQAGALLLWLHDTMATLKRVGVSAGTALGWVGPVIQDAAPIIQAAKSKDWATAAPPIRDAIREKQRNALVGYLMAKKQYTDPDQLFGDLYIDVQMSPAQLTSRIKQAISTVQSFTQRALLSLEPNVQLTEDAAREWAWRKSYRVWEANRKVFLYPENWIFPELRDDKSPFFETFERELRQKDVTSDTAEEAFAKYLESLDQVARLDVMAMYHQCEDGIEGQGAIDVLHVVGRTRLEPKRYFYRTRVDSSYWTPWEPIDVDIESDHLVLSVVNRRVHLFWAVIEDKADPPPDLAKVPEGGAEPAMHTEVKLAWSEYHNKKWSARRLSKGDPLKVKPSCDPSFLTLVFCDNGSIACLRQYDSLVPIGHFSFDPRGGGNLEGHGGYSWHAIYLNTPKDTWRICQDDVCSDSMSEDIMHRLELPSIASPVLWMSPPFRINAAHQLSDGVTQGTKDAPSALDLFFYKTQTATFFVERRDAWLSAWTYGVLPPTSYRFHTFYHPHADEFLKRFHGSGIPALLRWSSPEGCVQTMAGADFQAGYCPDIHVVLEPYPDETVDFSFGGAYSLYNWEVFFHIPFLVAVRLMENQRFDEAQKWFHYVFDPTAGGTDSVPQRFWMVKPFRENQDLASVQQELAALAADAQAELGSSASVANQITTVTDGADAADFDAQIQAWVKSPFNPYAIARLRLVAFQKTVVMKYIQNLIAWGDKLFARDTMESNNEAAQLYVFAGQLLGPRPARVRPPGGPTVYTYAQIAGEGMGEMSDPLVEAETLVMERVTATRKPTGQLNGLGFTLEPPPDLRTLLFCVPSDDMLLGLWDTVADRLFKLRNCMNIEGVVRQLPLFEPPIDPALLVRAAAAGVDPSRALDDLNALLPYYRFSVMHAKAMELASGVAALGGALLGALEKKDAEGLARLRSDQELALLKAVREVKQQQLREATTTLQGLQKSLELAKIKYNYYANLPKISQGEGTALAMTKEAGKLSTQAQSIALGAHAAHEKIPNASVGTSGWSSPVATFTFGGTNIGSAIEAASKTISLLASIKHDEAGVMTTLAGYDRRWEEWKHQEQLAKKEMEQIQKQIIAAEIRIAITQKEIDNQDIQIDHAREVGDHLRNKFTNEELYDWMRGELSTLYFQTYELAYDVAKRAERAYRFERAVESSSYITFGYWDSLKQGLLAGERLQHDLRKLDIAYLEQNAREYEITKHVSLAALDPAALMTLRATGTCAFQLDEKDFDLDYPGHYLRRLKSVSLTIPAVNGPYTGVSCTLALGNSSVRRNASNPSSYPRSDPSDGIDPRFSVSYDPAASTMVTSSGQNDSGLFELNFRDERYLPFEGAGAISDWTLSLPRSTNSFDTATISDVILHVRYTAREGGKTFADAAKNAACTASCRHCLISLRTEFPAAWTQFMNPQRGASAQSLTFQLGASSFPFVFGNGTKTVTKVGIYALWSRIDPSTGEVAWYSGGNPLELTIKKDSEPILPPSPPTPPDPPDPPTPPKTWKLAADLVTSGSSNFGHVALTTLPSSILGEWTMEATDSVIAAIAQGLFTQDGLHKRLDDSLQDIWLLLEYTQTVPSWA